ncbi:MAG: hypothetical protein LQ340_004704 [Diploschistes diacapsis]|nr:MAG: hypothetical protein LQ340_004704 [Diploschistes diacapsis]
MEHKEVRGYSSGASAYPTPQRRSRGPLIIFAVAAFIFFTIFFSTSSVQEVSSVAKDAAHHIPTPKLPSLPELPHFFQSSAHKPPIQKNSSSGDTKWYSDWKWLNPFSSSVTMDDTRAVLPPLEERPPIYTYYDPKSDRNPDVVEQERNLITIWRRAWWAQGFKPIVLGHAEAQKSPHYEVLGKRELDEGLKNELMRWLAWGHMGTGILANWLVLPMAPRDDHDLAFLRRGQYPSLTRYETLANGLFVGSAPAINSAVQSILNSPNLSEQKTLQDAIPDRDALAVQPKPSGIAIYDRNALSSHYQSIADEIRESESAGLTSLQLLLTHHLHGTFLETYPSGIAVLNSQGLKTTIMASPSIVLAKSLNTCPKTPLPASCPPNRPKCQPCKPTTIIYPQTLSNSTKLFTIGTIPHPYTLTLLLLSSTNVDVTYIRRQQQRDNWLNKVTLDMLTPGLSAYTRLVPFKDFVAAEKTRAHSIWRTAEQDWTWKDLEWHFGFSLPLTPDASDHSAPITLPTPVLNSEPSVLSDLLKGLDNKRPTNEALVKQADIVRHAKEALENERFRGPVDMRKVVEAWNLADTEAWRFVRALEAREGMERRKWEEEERRFVETME